MNALNIMMRALWGHHDINCSEGVSWRRAATRFQVVYLSLSGL